VVERLPGKYEALSPEFEPNTAKKKKKGRMTQKVNHSRNPHSCHSYYRYRGKVSTIGSAHCTLKPPSGCPRCSSIGPLCGAGQCLLLWTTHLENVGSFQVTWSQYAHRA
jgi:hypothetical protein